MNLLCSVTGRSLIHCTIHYTSLALWRQSILGKLHRNLLTVTDIVLESSPQSHDTGNLRGLSGPKVDYLFVWYTMP